MRSNKKSNVIQITGIQRTHAYRTSSSSKVQCRRWQYCLCVCTYRCLLGNESHKGWPHTAHSHCTYPLCFLSFSSSLFVLSLLMSMSVNLCSLIYSLQVFLTPVYGKSKTKQCSFDYSFHLCVESPLVFSELWDNKILNTRKKSPWKSSNMTEVTGFTVRTGWVCHSCCSWCRCPAHRQRNCPGPTSAW